MTTGCTASCVASSGLPMRPLRSPRRAAASAPNTCRLEWQARSHRNVLLRREALVAEEHDAILAERMPDLAEGLVLHRLREIYAADFRADIRLRPHDPDVLIIHALLPAASAAAV